ncbi:MAG: hypothetical protein JOZ70_01730 [Pseudolabrys sp.]|nr:hypothetical protein [Pseudolabrys sp.]MBV9953945.1 hypothetical protein [Pseudolabrys sp.]
MRVLFGLILGCALTIGGAYLYDSHKALAVANGGTAQEQPLVNWPVVERKWNIFSSEARDQLQQMGERAREQWQKHAG